MALLRRLSRIFKADFHAVLDRIEEPEALLKQAMREMEEELLQHEKSIKQFTLEQQQLALKQAESEQSLSELKGKLALCFEHKNDALAHPLIKQQLELQKWLKAIASQREKVEAQLAEHQTQLKEHRTLYESTRQKAEIFLGSRQSSVSDDTDVYGFKGTDSLFANECFSDEAIELELINQKQLWEKQLQKEQSQDKNEGVQS